MRRIAVYFRTEDSHTWSFIMTGDYKEAERCATDMWIGKYRSPELPKVAAIKIVEEGLYKDVWVPFNVVYFQERK
jgi:hypothetical protein